MTGSSHSVVAIDVGGTTIKGFREPDGPVVTVDTPAPERILDAIVNLVDRLRTEGTGAVAVVVPGLVEDGTVRYAANLGWQNVAVRSAVELSTGLPVVLENDVVAAALAEGEPDLLYVSLGTGIAARQLVGGQPLRGARGWAGELGHVVVRPGGEACSCGACGCLEVYASATGIARRYRARTGERRTAAELVGVPAAGPEWDDAVQVLADGLAIAVLLLDPALIVLGGGLSLAGDALAGPVRDALAGRLRWRPPPPLRLSRNADAGGRLGAARLARQAVPV